MRVILATLLCLVWCVTAVAGPRVDVVIGEKAPALERLAAEEIASQLRHVYEAEVKIATTIPADSPHVILVGSAETNASTREFAKMWPKLSDQGHVLRSVTVHGRPALVVCGGSPVATYWAAAEFGHRLGIRSMLYGDLYPVDPPPLKLDGMDVVLEPALRSRAWRTMFDSPISPESWGLEEQQRVLTQLAKLKFNRIILAVHPWQPFVHFEFESVKKQTGVLWYGRQFSVTGETAGRSAFGGAKVFENPDFAGTTTYEERIAAGQKLLRGIIATAHELGMTVGLAMSPLEFPKEFAAVLTQAQTIRRQEDLSIGPSPTPKADDELLFRLAKSQLRAYLDAYPLLDAIYLREYKPSRSLQPLILDFGLFRRADQSFIELHHSIHETGAFARYIHSIRPRATGRGAESVNLEVGSRIVTLSRLQVLPEQRHAFLHHELKQAKRDHQPGFVADSWCVGDTELGAYLLSRGSFAGMLSPQQACQDLVAPVCGDGVSDRVVKALDLIDQATGLIEQAFEPIDKSVLDFSLPVPDVVLKHYASDDPPPAWWGQVRENYLNAMNEMYRANTRARDGGRSFTLYWARRTEFGYEYMNCVESVRLAGIAKRKGDAATHRVKLEAAVESLHAGLNAMAAVARSNSDRGIIAVLNEYGYRPLMKELESLDAAAEPKPR